MPDLILHHFDASPFAEKIRLVFGLKNLGWHSVDIPMVMPKPDLTALTGGYRKTPVLQIGAEIYCDTTRIARELETRHPQPTLFPGGNSGIAVALAYWSNTDFFNPGAGLSMGSNEEIPEPILKDRREFFNFMDFSTLKQELPHLYTQLLAHVELVEEQLDNGKPFLAGEQPGWMDINAWFVIWMVRANVPAVAGLLEPYTCLPVWEQSMQAIGHGERREMTAADALDIAGRSEPDPGRGVADNEPTGLNADEPVFVEPDDYGKVPVAGRLITLSRTEITIQRMDDRAGMVNIHFPRAGYRVYRQ